MDTIPLLQEKVRREYALKIALLRLARQIHAAREALDEARGQHYAAKAALTEYETGLLPRLMDKARGRYPEKLDTLTQETRKAEAEVSRLDGHLSALQTQQDALEKELAALAGCREALAAAGESHPELRRREAAYLCEAALEALEESSEALLEYRKLIQGNTLQPLSPGQRAFIQGQADIWGEKCRELLEPLPGLLTDMAIPFELTGYYFNPRAYIASAAADHNRRDRLNRAIDQNLAYRRQLRAILPRLEE